MTVPHCLPVNVQWTVPDTTETVGTSHVISGLVGVDGAAEDGAVDGAIETLAGAGGGASVTFFRAFADATAAREGEDESVADGVGVGTADGVAVGKAVAD